MSARNDILSQALPALSMLTISLLCAGAQANVYGYIDADGITHVSTEKIDDRYQLFLRGDANFDSDTMMENVTDVDAKTNLSPPMQLMRHHHNLKKYDALLNQSASEFAVDPALLKAIMAAESDFNPGSISPKGAIGLMQIMPKTAERYGLQGDRRKTIQQKLSDPKTNIRLAARYLRDLQMLFPQRLELVIASYNAGEGAVQKYKNQIPPYPETRNYVQLVAQFYRLYQPANGHANNQRDNNGKPEIILPGRRSMPLHRR